MKTDRSNLWENKLATVHVCVGFRWIPKQHCCSMFLLPAAAQQGKEPEGADQAGGIWFGDLGGIVRTGFGLN